MSDFSASYLAIDEDELVKFLLDEAGQSRRSQVNPKDLLEYLNLNCITVEFSREVAGLGGGLSLRPPRALISFHDRLIATDSALDANRRRFSILHEIAHYVIPHHQNALYICDKRDMGFDTQVTFEQEANRVAAKLLFLADQFDIEANSHSISAATVKQLALQYHASFEATARRLVERNFRECMFVSFAEVASSGIDSNQERQWRLRYSIPSPSFRHKYFSRFTRGSVPPKVAQTMGTFQDIAQSVAVEMQLRVPGSASPKSFRAEYFHNTFNVFCILTPIADNQVGSMIEVPGRAVSTASTADSTR